MTADPQGPSVGTESDRDSGRDPSADPEIGVAHIAAALARLKQLQGSRRVAALMNRPAGIELSQQEAQVLRTLGDGLVRAVAELARAAHMDVGAVSRQVRALEERGLVTRSPSPDNGSVVLVELTSRGRTTASRLIRAGDRHLANSLAAWSEADRRHAGELLTRLVDDLQRTPYPSIAQGVGRDPDGKSNP